MVDLPYTWYYTKYFTCVTSLSPLTTLVSMFCYSHFRDEETDTQKIRSLAQDSQLADVEPGLSDPRTCF